MYAEDYPGNCFKGANSQLYVRKHNPFISFKAIQNDSKRCSRIVNAKELAKDVAEGKLSDFSFYIPDLKNDGHDTSPTYSNNWYSKTFGSFISDDRFMKDMLLVTTYDESKPGEATNHIYTSFYGAGVKEGVSSNTWYNHYNLLRTIEDVFGLATMANNDSKAKPILDVWLDSNGF